MPYQSLYSGCNAPRTHPRHRYGVTVSDGGNTTEQYFHPLTSLTSLSRQSTVSADDALGQARCKFASEYRYDVRAANHLGHQQSCKDSREQMPDALVGA